MTLQDKYRPATLEEVKGNKAALASIRSIFTRHSGDYPHAILLQGSKGCGKTTIARILKDILECEDGDYTEVNSSNERGIAVARKLQEDAQYRPFSGKTRVYLLDEIHKATKDFQNAMLKPLEDCPAHAYWILCTTDPQMLIEPLRSRCHIFEVQNLNRTECMDLLNSVLEKEKVNYISDDIKSKIYEASEGCPRDTLKILDQVIDLQTDEEVLSAIQAFNYAETNLTEIWKALLRKDSWSRLKDKIKTLDMSNPEQLRRSTVTRMGNILMEEDNPDAAMIYDCFKGNYYDTGKAGFIVSCYQATIMLG